MADGPNTLLELNQRSREVFRQLVETYLETGDPVGSRTLSKAATVSLSPASIRNVMADLEELGLLTSPHTSAGRMPTEAGLRLFSDFGFRAVSTRDIAKEAGVNAALLSYHFGGKDELFETVVRASTSDHVAERMQMLTKARAKGKTLTLEGLLELYLQPIMNNRKWSNSGDYFKIDSQPLYLAFAKALLIAFSIIVF